MPYQLPNRALTAFISIYQITFSKQLIKFQKINFELVKAFTWSWRQNRHSLMREFASQRI